MDTTLKYARDTMLAKIGEVAVRGDGSNFLLIWRRERRDLVYEGTVGGNNYFWTVTSLGINEIIIRKENLYTIRGSNSIGNGFYYVECQNRTTA